MSDHDDGGLISESVLDSDQVFNFEPTELPPNWSSYFDESYQTYYYVHNPSGHTQWEYPDQNTEVQPLTDDLYGVENPQENAISTHSTANPESLNQFSSDRRLELDLASSHSQDGSQYSIRLMTESYYKLHSPEKADVQWYEYVGDEYVEEEGSLSVPFSARPQEEEAGVGTLFDERYEDRIRKRNQQPATLHQGGVKQDYLGMAEMYRIHRPYANPKYRALCILCHENYAQDVFFPCEHHCVCRPCIQKENVCEERNFSSTPNAFINCSLCMNIIKLILPLDGGREVEKYWEWVYEDKVELPKSFLRNFKHSAGVIETVYVNEPFRKAKIKDDPFDNENNNCGIS